MKLIHKTHLEFTEGYITDDQSSEIICLDALASEVNELAEISDLNDFLKANAAKIDSATKPVVYHPAKPERPQLKLGKTAATPLMDADKADAELRAAEWLNVQVYKDIDAHLARYRNVAKFLAEPFVLAGKCNALPTKFVADPLSLTKAAVIDIVETYHSPEMVRLRNLVEIDFS